MRRDKRSFEIDEMAMWYLRKAVEGVAEACAIQLVNYLLNSSAKSSRKLYTSTRIPCKPHLTYQKCTLLRCLSTSNLKPFFCRRSGLIGSDIDRLYDGYVMHDILTRKVILYLVTKGRTPEAFQTSGSDDFVGALTNCDSTDFGTKPFSL